MKVFEHIDFNEFFEDKAKFDFRLPQIDQEPRPLDDIIMEGLMLEMAMGQRPGSGTRAAIRLDDDDIQYLYQFLPSDWTRALWWRYGPGLINYARSRHAHIPEHEDDNEDSNFHQVDKDGIPLNEEPTESISFDEDVLLGSSDDAENLINEHPALGGPDGKAKLDWMRPKGGYKSHHKIGKGSKTKRRYDNIKFGWNKLYHKLNRKYKFGMQRVDDRHWHEHGQLPNLSGYTPIKWEHAKDAMQVYWKALGMKHHHPEDHHEQLNNHQAMLSSMRPQKYEANDQHPIHEIIPMTHGTHNDGMWADGHPSAHEDKHTLQNSADNPAYTNHMYKLMNNVLGNGFQEYGPRNTKVQPFDLSMPASGASGRYNIYETFGLHKSLKQQDWELERYFPHEIHKMAWDDMEQIAKQGGSKSGINTNKANISQEQLEELYSKMKAMQFRWEPIHKDKVAMGDIPEEQFKRNRDGSIYVDQNGFSYYKVRDEFIARGMNEIGDLNNWMYRFLERYVNRFNPKLTRGLTHAQHESVTGVYRRIGTKNINNVINAHPELGFMHRGLDQKRNHQTLQDRQDRKVESDFNKSKVSRQTIRKGTEGEHDPDKRKIRLNKKYNDALKNKNKLTEDDVPQTSHTDVMVGGVFHEFGGPNGNIWERNNSVKNAKWEKIPLQRVFVPLLHRGQVLSSEKQLSKGLNVGAFGHSQASEVSTNHFGVSLHDGEASDEYAVSKETASRYYTDKELESKKNHDPEKPGTYLVNRNDVLWKAALAGKQPDEEFFENNEFDENGKPIADHNSVSRFTDHHRSHTREQPPEDQQDYVMYYNMEGQCGEPVEKGQGMPHLRSVHDGVCLALKKISAQANSEELVKMMASRLDTLWSWGDDLLKANVADPQFFYNPEYSEYLARDLEAIPEKEREGDGPVKRELGAPRKSGIKFEGSPQTGYVWRRKRVANYIQSFSQRGFDQNLLFRRAREGRIKGGEFQATDEQLDSLTKDMNESKDQWDVAEKRKQGDNKFMQKTPWERASAKNSWLRAGEIYAQAKKDAQNKFDIKSVNEMHKIGEAARNRNLAMLCLWAVESGKVPRAREIASNTEQPMIKEPVSREVAFDKNFPEEYHKKYNEAHAIQLNLALEWAKAHIAEDFRERVNRSLENDDGHWYDGPTKSIPDANFVKHHEDQDPIIEMFQNLHEYDARASFSLVKSDENYSHENEQNSQFYDHFEKLLPNGLFDFTTNPHEEHAAQFDLDLENKIKPLMANPESAVMAAEIVSDILLNGVDETTLSGNERGIRENGKIFRAFLKDEENNLSPEVGKVGDEFIVNLDRKINKIKSGDKKESKANVNIVISSIGKNHEAGRKEAVGIYDDKISKATGNKKEILQQEKNSYMQYYDKISDVLNHNHFDVNSTKGIGEFVQGLSKSQKFAWQALEDAFIDQMVEYLSHIDNFNERRSNVIESAKSLAELFKEQNVLKHFASNVKGEFSAIIARHRNAHGGKVA